MKNQLPGGASQPANHPHHQRDGAARHTLKLPGRRSLSDDWDEQVYIEFPANGQLRARKVVSRSNARATGKYPGFKTGRMLQYESLHEKNAMTLLDACPSVVTFHEQPCRIRYGKHNAMQVHFPDLLVVTAHRGKELWEVKEAADAVRPEIVTRTTILSRLLLLHGFQYRLVIAESFQQGPKLANARLLLKLGRNPVPAVQRERLRHLFQKHTSLPWLAFARSESGADLRPYICRLILEGAVSFNIDQPITDATQVSWVFNQRKEGEQSWDSLVSFKAH